MPNAAEYLRVKEAADLLNVAPNTVRSWGDLGKITQHRHPVNNYRLFKRSDLLSLLKQIEQPIKRKRRPR